MRAAFPRCYPEDTPVGVQSLREPHVFRGAQDSIGVITAPPPPPRPQSWLPEDEGTHAEAGIVFSSPLPLQPWEGSSASCTVPRLGKDCGLETLGHRWRGLCGQRSPRSFGASRG